MIFDIHCSAAAGYRLSYPTIVSTVDSKLSDPVVVTRLRIGRFFFLHQGLGLVWTADKANQFFLFAGGHVIYQRHSGYPPCRFFPLRMGEMVLKDHSQSPS